MDKVMFVGAALSVVAAFGSFAISHAPGVPPEAVLIGVLLLVVAVFLVVIGAIIGTENNDGSLL